ncbi:DUF6259 domain-containing protein, partial [Palaeococcus sp. (in: euryarchaeotes)]
MQLGKLIKVAMIIGILLLPLGSTLVLSNSFHLIALENKFLRLEFSTQNGFSLSSIQWKASNVSYVFSGQPIFRVCILNYRSEFECIDASSVEKYSYEIIPLKDSVKLVYDSTGLIGEKHYNIGIHFQVVLPKDKPESYWTIQVNNRDHVGILYVEFPVIGYWSLNDLRRIFLIMPGWGGGTLLGSPERFCCPGYPGHPCPTGEQWMQFFGMLDKERDLGIFLYTNDTRFNYKSFHWEGRGRETYLSVYYYPPYPTNWTYFSPGYSLVLGLREAHDWKDVIKPYSEWVSSQWWFKKQKQNSWLDQVHLVVYSTMYIAPSEETFSERPVYHATYEEIIASARKLKQRLSLYNGTVLFMLGGWERYGQGMAYPYVFPPAEGWDRLRYLVDTLHKMGYKVGFFIMGSFLSKYGPPEAPERLNHILRRWTGEPYSDSNFVFLDPASEYWRTNLVNISVELVKNTGVDLLSYDTVPHTPINYDIKSDHPVGGGNYSSTAWLEVFREIKKETHDFKPDLAIVTEGTSEFLIPYVDGFYSISQIKFLSPSNSTPADLLRAVYSQKTVQMGWWVSLREQYTYTTCELGECRRRAVIDDTASYLAVATLFLSGHPVSLGGFHVGAFTGDSFGRLIYDDKLSFYEELAYARSTYLNEFLVQGEKIKDFEYGERIELRCPRGELEGDTENGCRVLHVSPIQGAVWKSPEGDTAAIMINFWNRPVGVNVTSVFSSPDVLLINGLPYSIPRNGIVTLNPHGLMVLFSLKDKSRLKSYEMKIRDSIGRHLIEFERHMELSQINYPWIEVLSLKRSLNQNLSLSQL